MIQHRSLLERALRRRQRVRDRRRRRTPMRVHPPVPGGGGGPSPGLLQPQRNLDVRLRHLPAQVPVQEGRPAVQGWTVQARAHRVLRRLQEHARKFVLTRVRRRADGLLQECSKDEMADFPRRMRDWLFNIMRDLADRQELNKNFMKMEREAENNMTRRWANAAIWKFCELDGNPPDR